MSRALPMSGWRRQPVPSPAMKDSSRMKIPCRRFATASCQPALAHLLGERNDDDLSNRQGEDAAVTPASESRVDIRHGCGNLCLDVYRHRGIRLPAPARGLAAGDRVRVAQAHLLAVA